MTLARALTQPLRGRVYGVCQIQRLLPPSPKNEPRHGFELVPTAPRGASATAVPRLLGGSDAKIADACTERAYG